MDGTGDLGLVVGGRGITEDSNSVVCLPSILRKVGVGKGREIDAGMMTYEVCKSTFPHLRFLRGLEVPKPAPGIEDKYNYFKVVSAVEGEIDANEVADANHRVAEMEAASKEVSLVRQSALRELVTSFQRHHRFAVQVVFKAPYHHWDVYHVVELLQPRIVADRDISRIEFHNRGGRFIVLYCPVLLQALKAVHCLVRRIKRGDSKLFRDAAAVVNYFSAEKDSQTEEGSLIQASPTRMRKGGGTRERRRRLAQKILREQQYLPPGRNVVDQRVRILDRMVGRKGINTPSHSFSPRGDRVGSLPSFASEFVANGIITPFTSGFPLGIPRREACAVVGVATDPQVEGLAIPHEAGCISYAANGDTVTDFVADAGDRSLFATMRIDPSCMKDIPMDESLRDYDLLGEDRLPLRQRKSCDVYSSRHPPAKASSKQFWFDSQTDVFYRRCALHDPLLYFVDGDSRLSNLSSNGVSDGVSLLMGLLPTGDDPDHALSLSDIHDGEGLERMGDVLGSSLQGSRSRDRRHSEGGVFTNEPMVGRGSIASVCSEGDSEVDFLVKSQATATIEHDSLAEDERVLEERASRRRQRGSISWVPEQAYSPM